MPRANRHHIPGQVWHITHRCHKGEFLFKFSKDRKAWIGWLFEAKKRYGLIVLDYIVTSNHIHLLVVDDESDAISKSIQLVAGRTAREFNRRKGRRGAYWEDRYHATAIETQDPTLTCGACQCRILGRAFINLTLLYQKSINFLSAPCGRDEPRPNCVLPFCPSWRSFHGTTMQINTKHVILSHGGTAPFASRKLTQNGISAHPPRVLSVALR